MAIRKPTAPADKSAAMAEMLASAAQETKFKNGALIEGTVTQIKDDDVYVDIGYKSVGVIGIGEFGEGAEVSLNGAVIGSGTMQSEQDLLVEHCVPECSSTMLFKQVLGADSRGYLSGRVLVDSGAQQTTSKQTFASLLTSSMARAQALPQLEIYADDVKCNHGATVGKLDEAALFYMRQRGIPEPEACLLLQHAFVGDVLQHITDEAHRARFTALVEQKFRGQISRCNICKTPCKS